MIKGEFFFAAQKFSEAEKILPIVEHSAKALLMESFCFYSINFYDDALSSLENFMRKYPADKNIQYASYLVVLSNYEQILDEKKDLKPLLKTKKLVKDYIKKYNLTSTCQIIFSPSYEEMPLSELADLILRDGLNVRLQAQLHKTIWGPVDGK